MKKVSFGSLAILVLILSSCGAPEASCPDTSIEDWNSFINIEYKTNELDLEEKIGNFTGGEYTSDSSAFIYYFNRVERVPLSVWVNGESGQVQTIFMEILSYDENFDEDLQKAVDEFTIDDCESRYFGMNKKEIIEIMGEPQDERELEEGVESIAYDSEGFKYTVNFKFYESQNNRCTSISVNWFY
ncbi:hypothetical protein JYT21_00350 [bacterium AH-315-B15]|nr:hypothetical protein [bacterium AH-315-B15]